MAGRSDIKAGRAFVELLTKDAAFIKGLRNARKKLQDFGKAAAAMGKTLATTGGAVFAASFAALAKPISLASDLSESLSKNTAVFGDMAKEVEAFGATAAKALGMSKQEAIEAAATFGNFLSAMGTSRGEAKDMSLAMVKLAADLASFNNANPEDVLLALRSGLSGEAEPMRRFGVALSETAVKAKAAAMGLAPLGAELTEQQKIAARYQIIMDQTKTAQGDFARTSGGLANQLRILKATLKDAATSAGEVLLPTVTRLVSQFSKIVTAAAEWIAKNKELTAAILAGVAAIGAAGGVVAGLGVAIGAVGAAISALTTPVGIASAAIVGSLALVAAKSEEFRETVTDGFNRVLETAKKTGQGTADALSAGDSELAWKIALKGLEVAWHDLLNAMLDAGAKFAEEFGNMIKEQLHPKRILERMPGYQLGRSLTGGDENAEPSPIERFGQYLADNSARSELNDLLKEAERKEEAKKNDPRNAPVKGFNVPGETADEAPATPAVAPDTTSPFSSADLAEISRMDAITDAIRASLEDTAMGRAGVVSEAAKSGGASQAFFSAAAALASSQGSGNPMVKEQQKNNKLVEELIQVDRDMLDALKENTLEVIA